MAFSFYGNKQAVSILEKAISTGNISHAYLFYGDEGVGKKTIARQFAQAILCKGKDKPCMLCQSCKKILSGNHPDFIEIGGDTLSSKQGFTVDMVRKLIEDAYIKPNESRYKVFLLKNVESLLASSANTLLKILEEPPSDVVFLLTSENKSGVLKTITSRCVSIGIYSVSDEDCLKALSDYMPHSDNQTIKTAISLCEGSIGKAMFYANNPIGKRVIEISGRMENALFKKDELAFLQSVAELEDDTTLSFAVLKCFLSRLRIILDDNICKSDNYDEKISYIIAKVTDCVESTMDILLKNGNRRLTISRLCAEIFSS